MYGLPGDFDGSFLVGRRLEQVGFTENQVLLYFDRDIGIAIESSFEYVTKSGRAFVETPPGRSSHLMELLGLAVSEVVGERDGTLRVAFEQESWVICYDTSRQYESYKIRNGPKLIIV